MRRQWQPRPGRRGGRGGARPGAPAGNAPGHSCCAVKRGAAWGGVARRVQRPLSRYVSPRPDKQQVPGAGVPERAAGWGWRGGETRCFPPDRLAVPLLRAALPSSSAPATLLPAGEPRSLPTRRAEACGRVERRNELLCPRTAPPVVGSLLVPSRCTAPPARSAQEAFSLLYPRPGERQRSALSSFFNAGHLLFPAGRRAP